MGMWWSCRQPQPDPLFRTIHPTVLIDGSPPRRGWMAKGCLPESDGSDFVEEGKKPHNNPHREFPRAFSPFRRPDFSTDLPSVRDGTWNHELEKLAIVSKMGK